MRFKNDFILLFNISKKKVNLNKVLNFCIYFDLHKKTLKNNVSISSISFKIVLIRNYLKTFPFSKQRHIIKFIQVISFLNFLILSYDDIF